MVNAARAQLRRLPNRAQYDESSIHRIIDAGFLAHIGFLVDSQPFVIPTLYGRNENTIFFHGSAASRTLKNLAAGVAVCATVTLVDGLVFGTIGVQPFDELQVSSDVRDCTIRRAMAKSCWV